MTWLGCLPACLALPQDTEPARELLSPCACKGSMSHVHATCLREWLAVKYPLLGCRCEALRLLRRALALIDDTRSLARAQPGRE